MHLLQEPERIRAYDTVKAIRTAVDQVSPYWAGTKLAPILDVVMETRRVPAIPYLTNDDIRGVTTDLDSMIRLHTAAPACQTHGEFSCVGTGPFRVTLKTICWSVLTIFPSDRRCANSHARHSQRDLAPSAPMSALRLTF